MNTNATMTRICIINSFIRIFYNNVKYLQVAEYVQSSVTTMYYKVTALKTVQCYVQKCTLTSVYLTSLPT